MRTPTAAPPVPEGQRSRLAADREAHPVIKRMHHAVDRCCLAVRHRDAWTSATAQLASEHGFEVLRGHKVCLLTTYRRNGEPVPTPVWFGLADGKLYFRTEADVGKVKRIRNDPRVRVAPATMYAKPLGLPVEGRATLLPPSEWERAEGIIAPNYGLFRNVLEGTGDRLRIKVQYVVVERATDAAQPSA